MVEQYELTLREKRGDEKNDEHKWKTRDRECSNYTMLECILYKYVFPRQDILTEHEK